MTSLLIKAGHLFAGCSQSTIENAFVGVEGNRITAVGRQADLTGSSEESYAKIIDLGDDTCLLPGLINMHTHMSFSGGRTVFMDATTDNDAVMLLRIADNLRRSLHT